MTPLGLAATVHADRACDGFGPNSTAILGAVYCIHAKNGRVTVREVAKDVGRSLDYTHKVLRRLKAAGLVTWEPGTAGTLRPLVEIVGVR